MSRERENEQNMEMRQLAKDMHRQLGELLIRVGRVEERQLELEKAAIEDDKRLKEYVKDEIDYLWNSMVNYTDSQIEKVTTKNRTKDRRRFSHEQAIEAVIPSKADTPVPRCFSCDDYGHIGRNCPHAGTDLKICFECKQLVNHIAAECPQRLDKDGDQRQRNYDSRERYGHRQYNRQFQNRGDYRGIKRRREGSYYDSN